MELTNCDRCGKLQVQRPDTLCNDCQQIYLAEAQVVKEFIKNHPGITMMDVARHTGFSLRKIKEMLQ